MLVSKTKVITGESLLNYQALDLISISTSAAHCVQNKNVQQLTQPRDVIVYIGGHDLNNPYQPGTVSVSPLQIVVHPHWNPFVTRFDADIAVILLESELNFASNIVPVCMLSAGRDEGAEEGIIVGYGQSDDKTKLHTSLPRALKIPLRGNEDCFLDNYEFAKIGSNRTFCGGSKNGSGACRGNLK